MSYFKNQELKKIFQLLKIT